MNESLKRLVAERTADLERANAALRESEARFRSLTAMSSEFYWETDTEHRITRQLAGGQPGPLSIFRKASQIGKCYWELPYLSPDAGGWQAHRAALDARHSFRGFEFSRLGSDGVEHFASISGEPFFNAAGVFLGYRGVGADITERKAAEARSRCYLEQLETSFMSTVEVATMLSEMRDPYTAGHERQVGNIAAAIGAKLGFDHQRVEGLRVAGFLHDIGKITVPAEILSRPGRLSDIEYELIKTHPQSSYDVLKDVDFPWPVAQVALQHHERMDGSGYPQGPKGEAILLEARIVAVADVVEAMSAHRPYRPGFGIDAALSEIERGRGRAYDPGVADACLMLFREERYPVPA